ncbi:MAG: PH domain-containing protein [Candidatus Eisenbacteria bacterium]|nr:PH domain-containing protein [Candidatus Eisenbacteria bacterium]
MGQLEKVLSEGEPVAFRTRLHWLPCCPGALALSLVALLALVLPLVFAPHQIGDLFARAPAVAATLVAVLALALVVPLLVVRFLITTHEFAVTDRRVVAKMGWLRSRTLDLNVTKVESMEIDQGVLGRMFGYGDVRVVGTGGTAESFRGVKDPIGFRKAVNAAADSVQAKAGGA